MKKLRKSNLSSFHIEATDMGTAHVKVEGMDMTWYGKSGLAMAVTAWAERKWGVRLVDDADALLGIVVQLSIGDAREVHGQFSVPVDITMTIRSKDGQLLFEKSGRHAGLARTEHQAREQAFKRMVRQIKKW